jgi:hypothetical protein
MAHLGGCRNGHYPIYQTIYPKCEFIDIYRSHSRSRGFFIRNHLFSQGVCLRVVKIGSQCFECVNIVHLVISRNIEVFGECCFGHGKLGLMATEYSSHLCYFGPNTFAFVKNLRVLFVPPTVYSSSSDFSLDRRSESFLGFEGECGSSRIDVRAFSDCPSLQLIIISSSVRILAELCFGGCRSLSILTFESNSTLDRIEARAFSECSSLKSICIPSSVTILCELGLMRSHTPYELKLQ